MSEMKAPNPRLTQLVDDLLDTIRGFIRDKRVTHDEYRQAVGFLTQVAEKGEIPLLLDVFLEATVDEVDSAGRAGTETTVEGPFYASGAPEMKTPAVLPHRSNEPGEVLVFTGSVRSTDGAALSGAVLDLWQSDAEGAYSHFNIPPADAPWNLRARVSADQNGRFEVRTWVPSPYQIPKDGPTGALIKSIGRHPWRPAHLHIRITHEGCETLTTQIFFTDDPWINSDVVGAVKKSLIVTLEKHEDAADLRAHKFDRPYYALNYDFILPRSMAKAA
ncbi:MAG TPA: dioxygenase [Candidatus Binataceae bacterium]|nr:dioxygenase [Candidatus Binataceae bacterium]